MLLDRFASVKHDRSHRCLFATLVAFTIAVAISPMLGAQELAPKPVGPRTLIGIVTDTLGAAMANADVSIPKLARSVRSGADGAFRFDDVDPGTYAVNARSVGYISPNARVDVGGNGGSVHLIMIRFGTIMPSVVTTAARNGLSGVVGDTAHKPLWNVKVTIMGASGKAETDSTGSFFIPLGPGTYMLRLERSGYARQVVGVTVPKDQGRNVAAWMAPQAGNSNATQATRLFELNQRLIRMSPTSSKFFSRDDLVKLGLTDLSSLAHRWAEGVITGGCEVSINGDGREKVPLTALFTLDVEFVELYQRSSDFGSGQTRGPTSLTGNPTKFITKTSMRPGTSPDCGNLMLIAWLRN